MVKFLTLLMKDFQGPMDKHILDWPPPSLPLGLRASCSVHYQRETTLVSSQSETHMLAEDGARHCLIFPLGSAILSFPPCTPKRVPTFSASSPSLLPPPPLPQDPGSIPAAVHRIMRNIPRPSRKAELGPSLLPSVQVIKLSGSSEQAMNKTSPSHQD